MTPSDYPPCEGCILDAECADWLIAHGGEGCLIEALRQKNERCAIKGIPLPEVD